MTSRTVTTVLDAPKAEVFDYVADVENLPEWANEFARELVHENGLTKVVNGLGEFVIAFDADPGTGVVDMRSGPTADELALFPTRVVELPGGRSAFIVTMFRATDMPDELFESQYQSLLRELEGMRRRFAA